MSDLPVVASGADLDEVPDGAAAPTPQKRRWWLSPVARFVIGLLLGAAALYAVSGQRSELAGVTAELSRLNPFYVAMAVVSEFLSFVAFARMQGRLLECGSVHMPGGRLLGLTAAASAIASSIPAGPAVSTVYAYRQYRRAGADESIAGWALVAILLSSALGLVLVSGVGVVLAERQGAALDLVDVTAGLVGVTGLAMFVFTRRRFVITATLWCLRIVKRFSGRPKMPAEQLMSTVTAHLSQVHLTWRSFTPAFIFSIANWAFDCGCLAFAYSAVGAGVPWRGLLLAYGAGQLAANLPITPGGLGVVEGSLTIALVEYGGVRTSTVAAVILYRIISFWAFLPCGWAAWAGLVAIDRRADRRTPPPAEISLGRSTAPLVGS
jgi:uncharacterized protein (TIRG00374 family)